MANQTLTVSFVQNPGGTTLDMQSIDGDPGFIMTMASVPSATRGQYLATLFGRPNLIAEGVNNNDTAALALELVDLTTQGVTFPATTMRQIRWRHFLQTDNDRFYVEYERWVLGGTTPVLLGTRRVVHAHGVIAGTVVAYGDCHAATNYDSSDTATTATVGTSEVLLGSTAGSSIGNVSTNTATLTHPVARTAGKRFRGVNAAPDVATNTEQLHASVFPASSTTASIFTVAVTDGAADGFDDDGRLECEFFILPPGDADLVMNSNNVELQVTGIDSDETRHRVEIFIGPAVQVAFQGS